MRLGLKLLIAPVATAAVLLAAAGTNAWYGAHQRTLLQQQSAAQVQMLGELSSQKHAIARMHADVYRTVALIASLDEA
jgi:hypothetical protein